MVPAPSQPPGSGSGAATGAGRISPTESFSPISIAVAPGGLTPIGLPADSAPASGQPPATSEPGGPPRPVEGSGGKVPLGGKGSAGELTGVVFEDADADGALGKGDRVLPDRTVVLQKEENGKVKEVGRARTGADGVFHFRGLPAGKYRVSVEPAGAEEAPKAARGEPIELRGGAEQKLNLPLSATYRGGAGEGGEAPNPPEEEPGKEPLQSGFFLVGVGLFTASGLKRRVGNALKYVKSLRR